MKLREGARHLAAIAMLGIVTTGVTSAWARTRFCQSPVTAWFTTASCQHPVTGKDVVVGGGSGSVNLGGDRYVVLSTANDGVPIIRAQLTAFDSNGSVLADCNPTTDTLELINFFGLSEPACDQGVTYRVSALFAD